MSFESVLKKRFKGDADAMLKAGLKIIRYTLTFDDLLSDTNSSSDIQVQVCCNTN